MRWKVGGLAKQRLQLLAQLTVIAGCREPVAATVDIAVTADPATCPTTDLAALQIGCEATAMVTVRDPDDSVRLECLPVSTGRSLTELLTGLEPLKVGSILPGATLALSVYGGVFECGTTPGAAPLLLSGITAPFPAGDTDGVQTLVLACSVGQENACGSALESCLDEASAASCEQVMSNFEMQCDAGEPEEGCYIAQDVLSAHCSDAPRVTMTCDELFSDCLDACADQLNCEGACSEASSYCEEIAGRVLTCFQAYDTCIAETAPSCSLTAGAPLSRAISR